MSKSTTVTVKILGDAKGLKSELGDAEGALGRFGHGVGSVAKGVGVGLVGIGVGFAALAPQILTAGAEMEALGRKAATVFEGSLGGVQSWADANAAAMGLTADKAVGLGAGIADLLKPMGFSADAAAGMATDMLDLSGALSAWTGGQKSAAEVSDIITKAMLGERDGLKALGISISEADVSARLAANGQSELTGAALEQAKALATQQLIMEKSTDAQAAWADGSMDSLKAQNEAKASMDQLKETAIKALYPALQALVPVATKMAEWLGEHLPGAIAWLKEVIADLVAKFKEWWPSIQAVIGSVVDWLTNVAWPAIQAVWDAIASGVGALVGWVREHWDQISSVIGQAIGFVRGLIESAVMIIQTLWATFGNTLITYISDAWEFIKGIVSAAMEFIHGVINVVMGLIHGDFGQVWDGIKAMFSAVWDGIKVIAQGAVDGLKALLSLAWDGIKLAASLVWDAIKAAAALAWELIKAAIMLPINTVKDLLSGVWDGIKAAASLAWAILSGAAFLAWDGIKTTIMTPINAVKGLLQGVWDGIKTAAETAWNGVKAIIQPIVDAIKAIVQGLIDTVQGAIDIFNSLKSLAGTVKNAVIQSPILERLATGRIVTSPTVAMIGEAGAEAVIPLTNPRRALDLMRASGLDALALESLWQPEEPSVSLDSPGGGMGAPVGPDPREFVAVVGPALARVIRQELRAA